jgi:hypothetical protein
MPFLRKYNTLTVTGSTAIRIPMIKRAVVDFAVGADWTPAAGDVKIAIDGTAPANVANLPTAVASGNGAFWEFILTAAELTCKQCVVVIADAATKAVEDQSFIVETYGNASAMYAADLSAANLPANVIQVNGTAQTARDLGATLGVAGAGLTALGDARIANLDATVSSRSTLGGTAQTGDAFARLGVAGVGLTNLGDARIANLDATVSSRTKPADTQAAVTLVTTTTNLTNAATAGDLTATMKASVTTAATASTPALSAAGVTAIWNEVLEGAVTARGMMRGFASALLAICSGMATGTGVFRDLGNTKPRITATQDANGNRSAVVLDLT